MDYQFSSAMTFTAFFPTPLLLRKTDSTLQEWHWCSLEKTRHTHYATSFVQSELEFDTTLDHQQLAQPTCIK